MDDVKISNFRKTHGGKEFPTFQPLAKSETREYQRKVAEKLGVPDATALDIIRELKNRGEVVTGYRADDKEFDLRQVFGDVSISPRDQVLVNWSRFDDIDAMTVKDVELYFEDIWYPAVDYVDIFDSSLSWILSIGYSGEVLILRF